VPPALQAELAAAFSATSRTVVEHAGGHVVPKTAAVFAAVREVVGRALARGEPR
jgi:hypothetical protein